MATLKPGHPSLERLAAFDQGKLSPAERAALEEHLVGCDSCCRLLDDAADDSFVAKVRAAGDTPASMRWPLCPPRDLPIGRPAPKARRDESHTPTPIAGRSNRPGLEPGPGWEGPDPMAAALADHQRYRIRRKVGAGGMGVVYLAEHRLMKRDVALKVINPELLAAPTAVARFTQEVNAAGRLAHPNIVRAYDAEQVGGVFFLAMEYVEGTNLAALIAKKKRLKVDLACHLARQAALGLQHAHEKGMVHRDVKPHNMIVTAKGVLKLLDFGLARVVSEDRPAGVVTRADELMGTPDYVAPEQVRDARTADIRADIYGLGCTLYHMLAGHPPFPGGQAMQKLIDQVLAAPPRLSKVRDDVPAELEAVVARMMAKDPARRYGTPAEVAQALTAFLPKPAPRPQPASKPAEVQETKAAGRLLTAVRRRVGDIVRRPVAAAVVGLALLGAALAGVITYTMRTPDGEVVIEAVEKEVELSFNGRLIRLKDLQTGKTITLQAGKYKVEIVKGPPGLVLETDTFTLKRGDRVIVRIRWKDTKPPPPESEVKEWFKEVAVSDDRYAILNPAVAMGSDGRSVAVWKQQGKDGWDVVGRQFDRDGKPVGDPLQIMAAAIVDRSQGSVRTGMAPDGRYVVAWGGKVANKRAVYARRFTAKGEPAGAAFQVNTKSGEHPEALGVATASDGTFIVIYGLGEEAGNLCHVYAQRFDTTGKPRGAEIKVTVDQGAWQGGANLAIAPDGRFAVVVGWRGDVLIHRFNADGSRAGREMIANTLKDPGERHCCQPVFDSGGQLYVLWYWSPTQVGSPGFFLRRYNPQWEPVGEAERRITDGEGSPGGSMGQDGKGNLILTWHRGYDKVQTVWMLVTDSTGQPLCKPRPVSSEARFEHASPRIAVSREGRCVVVWQHDDVSSPRPRNVVLARGFLIQGRAR